MTLEQLSAVFVVGGWLTIIPAYYVIRTLYRRRANNPGSKRVIAPAPPVDLLQLFARQACTTCSHQYGVIAQARHVHDVPTRVSAD